MNRLLYLMIILAPVLSGCRGDLPRKYIPATERGRDRYATPEPGTYLRPVAYTFLNEFKRLSTKPDSFRDAPEWLGEVFAVRQKKLLDTVIAHNGIEVPVRIYYPTKKSMQGNHPVILFIHGGGFVMGSIEDSHIMVSKLARVTGWIIVSVEYRLAPEFPFPAALEDCFAALSWIHDQGRVIGADTSAICVMGSSAGGNLATVLTLKSRDEGLAQPCCQVLIYPGVTFRDTPFPSRLYFARSGERSFVLTEAFLMRVKAQYMAGESDEGHPYLSPLEARLTPDLPPALIITAECDPLRDEGRLYAAALKKAGVPVVLIEYSGMIHGFMSLHMILPEALDALHYIRDYLNEN
jgi:acetyl esterase